MTPETIKAIKESIAKWDIICHGMIAERGKLTCPLCEMYITNERCTDCPITMHTKYPWCHLTPYKDFYDEFRYSPSRRNRFIVNAVNVPAACDAAEAEVEFMISLLPYKERKAYDKIIGDSVKRKSRATYEKGEQIISFAGFMFWYEHDSPFYFNHKYCSPRFLEHWSIYQIKSAIKYNRLWRAVKITKKM